MKRAVLQRTKELGFEIASELQKSVKNLTLNQRLILSGIIVGAIALVLPEVMGTGQATIDAALSGQALGWRSGAVTLAKIAATSATLGTGGSGGAFMPAIFIGAAAGNAWATLAAQLFHTALPLGAYALVGMSAVVTSSYRCPVTAMILALEVSHDYGILMLVMFACVLAHLTTRVYRETPVLQQ
ncbi:MAG: chloride channel protein [Elusimicrobia bacterium]|nr:chloride channel protein [Elusimicrobiota bacterium]